MKPEPAAAPVTAYAAATELRAAATGGFNANTGAANETHSHLPRVIMSFLFKTTTPLRELQLGREKENRCKSSVTQYRLEGIQAALS